MRQAEFVTAFSPAFKLPPLSQSSTSKLEARRGDLIVARVIAALRVLKTDSTIHVVKNDFSNFLHIKSDKIGQKSYFLQIIEVSHHEVSFRHVCLTELAVKLIQPSMIFHGD